VDAIKRTVTLTGLRDMMLDRYAGDNVTQLEPQEKLYLDTDGKTLIFPIENMISFLAAENTKSCVNMFGGKGWRDQGSAIKSCMVINPDPIVICDEKGKAKRFSKFVDILKRQPGDVYIKHAVAKIKKTASIAVPNPKVRPVISLPWQITFTIDFLANEYITEKTLRQYFEKGGIFIGLGTYRPVYGKFSVTQWE